jgi:hypothetical protein
MKGCLWYFVEKKEVLLSGKVGPLDANLASEKSDDCGESKGGKNHGGLRPYPRITYRGWYSGYCCKKATCSNQSPTAPPVCICVWSSLSV